METKEVLRAARGLVPLVLVIPVTINILRARQDTPLGLWPIVIVVFMVIGIVLPVAKRLSRGRVEERIGLGISRSYSSGSAAKRSQHVDDIMSTYDPPSDDRR